MKKEIENVSNIGDNLMSHTFVMWYLCLITSDSMVWWHFRNSHCTCGVLSKVCRTRVASGSTL